MQTRTSGESQRTQQNLSIKKTRSRRSRRNGTVIYRCKKKIGNSKMLTSTMTIAVWNSG